MQNSVNSISKSVYITLLLGTRLTSCLASTYQWYFPCCLYLSVIIFLHTVYICHLVGFSVAFFCTVFFSVFRKYSIEKESYLEADAYFRNP